MNQTNQQTGADSGVKRGYVESRSIEPHKFFVLNGSTFCAVCGTSRRYHEGEPAPPRRARAQEFVPSSDGSAKR